MLGFYLFLAAGMVAMMCVMVSLGKYYDISAKKCIIAAMFLTVIGYAGTKLMFYIECGSWEGRSLFGSLFLVPVLMYPVAKLLKVDYKDILDISAPAGALVFSLMKVKCKIDGCCFGKVFFIGTTKFLFPSAIVEAVANLIIAIVLYRMVASKKYTGKIYFWFMVIYGAVRFVLNLFRFTEPWILGMPAGNFWSLVSLAIGLIGLLYYKKQPAGSAA